MSPEDKEDTMTVVVWSLCVVSLMLTVLFITWLLR